MKRFELGAAFSVIGLLVLASLVLPLPTLATEAPYLVAPISSAYNVARITTEPELQQALRYLAQGPGVGALRRITTLPIRLVFKPMEHVGPQFAHYDALAWMSHDGQVMIIINQRHRGAPPAALAALLAHEAMHHDAFNSVDEEVDAWHQEALTWAYWQHQQPALLQPELPQRYPLVERLNILAQALKVGKLEAMVRQNTGYKQLPQQSPVGQAHRYTQHDDLAHQGHHALP
jgi:hypothetical protein